MNKASDYLVAFEAGHGLHTLGKETPYIPELGRKIKEWEFNSATANFLEIELDRCGFRTLYISPASDDMPLKQRTDMANSAKADIYTSIHFNAMDFKFDPVDPEGHSVHIYPGSKEGRRLAENIMKYLVLGTPQRNRGIVEQNLHITRETHMPAVVIENGFMDSRKESMYMLDENFQREVAREVAMGICDYFNVPYIKAIPTDSINWNDKPLDSFVTWGELVELLGLKNTPSVETPLPKVKKFRKFDTNIYAFETNDKMIVSPSLGIRNKKEKLRDIVANENALMGINLGFYTSDSNSEHIGLFINKGLYFNPPNADTMDMIYYKNGTTKIVNYKEYNQATLSELQEIAYWAVGSSYSLVQNGEFNIENYARYAHSTRKNPRTMLGWRLDGSFVLVVTDGRIIGSSGLTAQEQSEIMLHLGCYNAVNFDGGGSTIMIENENGEIKVINRLQNGYERYGGSVMLVKWA